MASDSVTFGATKLQEYIEKKFNQKTSFLRGPGDGTVSTPSSGSTKGRGKVQGGVAVGPASRRGTGGRGRGRGR